MRARIWATGSALMLTGALFASCTGGNTNTTIEATTTTTSATTQPVDQFGFVRSLNDGVLVFDPAELLTGEEALAAARNAGVIGADEELPNDFFIQNADETDERQLAVADGAEFLLIGFDASGGLIDSPVSTDELALLFSGSADTSEFYGFVPGDLPMTLRLLDDTVTGGKQVYLP